MSAPKMTAQHRTTTASRLKIRILGALHHCIRTASEIAAKQAEEKIDAPPEDGGGQQPPPDPNALFSQALTEILEEELKAQPGTVDRALQMETLMHMLPQVMARLDRQHQESLLHRETLAMILQQQIKGSIEQTDIRKAAAKTLGVELSQILVP